MNEAEEIYSEERLQETLNAQGKKDVREILAAVRQDVGWHIPGLKFCGPLSTSEEAGENKGGLSQ